MCAIPRQVKDEGNTYVSKYQIIEQSHGFRVEGVGVDRVPVTVEWCPYYLAVLYQDPATGKDVCERFSFYEFYAFSQRIAEVLMLEWEAPQRQDRPRGWNGLQEWAINQTAWALRKRIHIQWQQLLQQVDPTVLAVQRKIFAATLRCSPLALQAELYRDPYLVHDITTYRAASMATMFAYHVARFEIQHTAPIFDRLWDTLRELRHFPRYLDIFRYLSPKDLGTLTTTILEFLHNWRGLFSATGEPYRSLNKTLMQLSGGVPWRLVGNLSRIHLQRPLIKRTELIVVSYLAEWRVPACNLHVFHHARAPQIAEAMRRVAAHTRNDLSPRRTQDLKSEGV